MIVSRDHHHHHPAATYISHATTGEKSILLPCVVPSFVVVCVWLCGFFNRVSSQHEPNHEAIGRIFSTPQVAGGMVYFSSNHRTLLRVYSNTHDGRVLFPFSFPIPVCCLQQLLLNQINKRPSRARAPARHCPPEIYFKTLSTDCQATVSTQCPFQDEKWFLALTLVLLDISQKRQCSNAFLPHADVFERAHSLLLLLQAILSRPTAGATKTGL